MKSNDITHGIALSDSPTEEEISIIHKSLEQYNREQTNGEYDQPGIEINLVLKDNRGQVVGGLKACTVLRVMHLDLLWVAEQYRKMVLDHLWLDERHRGLGLGKMLVMEAERIAQERGCLACQTYCFSFQASGFFEKLGYEAFAISDGYPDPVKEYYLIKKFK